MKNTSFGVIVLLTIAFTSCQFKNNNTEKEQESNIHKVVALEVLQATAYTYLNVTENGNEQWIAVPKMMAQIGETYYYTEFLEMQNFQSKDLQRNFSSVYFIQAISTEKPDPATVTKTKPMTMPAGHGMASQAKTKTNTAVKTGGVQIKPAKGGISIEELYANRKQYSGKKIIIKGIVVKANFEIMKKNWFHIQDGSGSGNDFDLTITSNESDVKIGDIYTFEGTIVLDKDFGHGYAYDILMEEAKLK